MFAVSTIRRLQKSVLLFMHCPALNDKTEPLNRMLFWRIEVSSLVIKITLFDNLYVNKWHSHYIWNIWSTSPALTPPSLTSRTGTCHIRDIFALFWQGYCALQELLMKINFSIAVAPLFVHPMMSLPAMPTQSVQKYGFLNEPAQQRQVTKYVRQLKTL